MASKTVTVRYVVTCIVVDPATDTKTLQYELQDKIIDMLGKVMYLGESLATSVYVLVKKVEQ